MSVSSETAQFDLIVNDGQAKRALAETRTSAQQLGGGLKTVVEGLDHLGGKSGKDAGNALRSLSFAMGSFGGRAGEAVAVAGDLADLIGGGPFTIGFAAAGAAATAAAFAYTKISDAMRDAKESAGAFDRAIAGISKSLDTASQGRLDELTGKLRDLGVQLKNVGKDSDDIEIRTQKEHIVRLNKDLERIGGLAFKNATNPNIDKDAQGALATILEKQREMLRGEAIKSVGILDDFIKEVDQKRDKSLEQTDAEKRAEAFDLRVKRVLKVSADLQQSQEDLLFQQLDREDAAAAAAREAEDARNTESLFNTKRTLDEEIAERLKFDAILDTQERKRTDAERRASDQRVAIAKREADEKKAIQDQLMQEYAGYASTALGIATSASQQLIDDAIKGQENAAERFAISVFKQAGTALVGEGIKTTGAGIGQLAVTGGVLGGQAVATGALLIGAGLGLGGIGSGIEASLGVGTVSPGPGVGVATDPGVAPRGASAVATGPAVVNVHFQYGLGPAPEKMARDLASAMDFARARGILVRDGRGTGRLQ